MVRPMHRSRTFRRIKVKTPGGETKVHFRRRKPAKAVCGACGINLQGVPREIPSKMANMPKTHKRPERPFGGVLCGKCMKQLMKEEARFEETVKTATKRDE